MKIYTICAALFVINTLFSHAQEVGSIPGSDVDLNIRPKNTSTATLSTRTTVGGRFSSDVQEYYGDLLVSPWSTENVVLLLNLRGTFLEGEEQEANGGLILRRITDNKKLIYGANVFYDSRWTANDNQFSQLGGGVELLSEFFDFRANYYYPVDDEEVLSVEYDSVTSESIRDGARVTEITTRAFTIYEEALDGYDVELGLWLPFISDVVPTSILGGYYDFSSDFGEDISGFRARLESRLCSYMTFDAEWYEDDELNQTDYFVGFRLHLPTGKASTAETQFEDRLFDMIHRDFRIRTRVTQPIETITARDEVSVVLPPPTAQLPPSCRLDFEGNVICEPVTGM